MRHGREVVDELGLSKSKTVSSPATVNGATRCQGDELNPLDEEGKRLYQRSALWQSDRLDLIYATSCLASAVSSPRLGDMQAAEASWTILEQGTCCLAGFPLSRPTAIELLCYTDADCHRQDFSEVNERVCCDSCLLGEETEECCTVKLGERAVRSHHVGHEIFVYPERVDGSWAQLQCHFCDRQTECH